MSTFIIFIICTIPILAVLALCAFVADVILPHLPRVVDWINEFLRG